MLREMQGHPPQPLMENAMKIFNVSIHVSISQIGQIPDEPPEPETKKPFNDDPLDKQEKIMDKYLDRISHLMGKGQHIFAGGFPGDEMEGASMKRNIRIVAEDFEELQGILSKFNETAKQLHAVPDSLFKTHPSGGYATPAIG
jgi:hypothetical protein